MRFLGPVAQKLVGVMVSWCFSGPFGAKSVKIAQKAKNDPKMHFGSSNVTLGQKDGKLFFSHFEWFVPPGPPFGLTIVTFRAKWRNDAFFNKNQFAELIFWNINARKWFPYQKWFPTYKSQKSTFRLLSFLRGCRVHREARGAQGALWSKKIIFCVLERKGTPFAKFN